MSENIDEVDSTNQSPKKQILNDDIYMIRHAQSLFNAADDGELKEYKFPDPLKDPALIDPPLSPKGVSQCLTCNYHLPRLKYVLVSPMRRTLETAYLLFRNHSNYESIRFIVVPDLREGMAYSCDVPDSEPESVLSEYRGKFIRKKNDEYYESLETQKIDDLIEK